jgi:ComF family protein
MPNIFSAAVAVFFPIACAGCSRPDTALCAQCRRELVPALSEYQLSDGTRLWAALPYRGALRSVILQFKENNRTDTARFLAPLLAAAITSAERDAARDAGRSAGRDAGGDAGRAAGVGVAPVVLVCVPSSAGAWRRRGYRPVELVVKRAGFAHAALLVNAVGGGVGGGVQKLLTADERLLNRRGAFRARGPLTGQRIILVDDVMTTGATLEEAVRAIGHAGGTVVGAAVVAFTPLNR